VLHLEKWHQWEKYLALQKLVGKYFPIILFSILELITFATLRFSTEVKKE
jgi:hypothetical protein